jgi:hypothetical protein
MSIGASPAPVVADNKIEAAVEVRVRDRWDALALSELLVPFHSFLVQRTPDHWVVHARTPGCHGEPLLEALRAIEGWRAERGLDVPVRVSAQTRGG